MFQFPAFPTYLAINTPPYDGGVTPFGNQRLITPTGGLIFVIALMHASFIGSNYLGIRH